MKNYYNEKVAQTYDFDSSGVFKLSRTTAISELLKYVDVTKLSSVLDIGCGTGNSLSELLKHVNPPQINGLDLSNEMLQVASSKIPQLNYVCDIALNMDKHFALQSNDIVLLHFLLAYVDRNQLFTKIYHQLTPGGVFSLCTTTVDNTGGYFKQVMASGKLDFLKKFPFKCDMNKALQNYMRYMPANNKSIEEQLKQHGFKILSSKSLVFHIKLDSWHSIWNLIYESG